MANLKKIHRVLGLLMLLPLLAWAITGVVFLTKPGYAGAYERLEVKTYKLNEPVNFDVKPSWDEVRLIKSIIGVHLLVQEDGQPKHYDPETFSIRPLPDEARVAKILRDAIQANANRYGELESVKGSTGYTQTGIKIQLDWDSMTLSQRGQDRKIIETLYEIHYLQWTPWEGINLLLGVIGLMTLASLTILGVYTYLIKLGLIKKKYDNRIQN